MSNDPIEDAARHYDAPYSEQARQETAEIAAAIEFKKSCAKCDANALATFAPTVTDWDKVKRPIAAGSVQPQRYQTVAEAMYDTLDLREAARQAREYRAFATHCINANGGGAYPKFDADGVFAGCENRSKK